jgi:hypothetical protein
LRSAEKPRGKQKSRAKKPGFPCGFLASCLEWLQYASNHHYDDDAQHFQYNVLGIIVNPLFVGEPAFLEWRGFALTGSGEIGKMGRMEDESSSVLVRA